MYYIYVIINNINKKIYVGQSIDIEARWDKHCSVAKSDYNHPLYNSIRKYGVENFVIECIETFDNIDDCNNAEEHWIEYLQTRNREFGYNIAKGGMNREMCQETKDKIATSMMGENNPFFGKTHSDETKQKLSEFRTGTTHTEETKQKMSESRIGENNGMFGKNHTEESKQKISESRIGKYVGEDNPFFGKTHSEESKQKMSEANKGKIITQETRDKISESLKGKMSGENNPMFGKTGEKHHNFGKPLSQEVKDKISKSKLGKKRKPMTKETKRKISEARKGKKFPKK